MTLGVLGCFYSKQPKAQSKHTILVINTLYVYYRLEKLQKDFFKVEESLILIGNIFTGVYWARTLSSWF